MLQDLDLGALGIPPQQLVQPFQFGHDPRGVHPRRRERRGLLDGRSFRAESLERHFDRPALERDLQLLEVRFVVRAGEEACDSHCVPPLVSHDDAPLTLFARPGFKLDGA